MAVLSLEDASGQINTKKVLIAGNQKVFHKSNIVNMDEINRESLERHEVLGKFKFLFFHL